MAFASINGTDIHFRRLGKKNRPKIAFLNSLGSEMIIWQDVADRLGEDYDILLFDQRGHGLSTATAGPYSISLLTDDLLGLLDHVGWERAILCGVSVGGMIAMEAAARSSGRVAELLLFDTASKIGTGEMWNARIAAAEHSGIASISEQITERWFPRSFRDLDPAAFRGWRRMLERTPLEGYTATCAALRDADLADTIREIAVPTLVAAGSEDASTPPDLVMATARSIPGASYIEIPGAGHLPCIDRPGNVASLIRDFTSSIDKPLGAN